MIVNSSRISTITAREKLHRAETSGPASFFKYCVAKALEGNPARLVPLRSCPSASHRRLCEEMNGFLNQLGATGQAARGGARLPQARFVSAASAVKRKAGRVLPCQSKKLPPSRTGLLELLTPLACASANLPPQSCRYGSKGPHSPRRARAARNASSLRAKVRKPWKILALRELL